MLRATRSGLADRVTARLALLEGKPAEAERIYAELAKRLPNDTAGLIELADAQSAQGNLAGSTETLKRVTALDPSDARAWFLLGKNAILMGESGRAVNDYLLRCLTLQTQLRNEQGEADALNAIGAAYHQLGDYPQAAREVRRGRRPAGAAGRPARDGHDPQEPRAHLPGAQPLRRGRGGPEGRAPDLRVASATWPGRRTC